MFGSSPASGSKSMHLMYLLAITAAQRTIHLSSAYFVPDKLSSQARLTALERGVKVQIIVPGEHSDAAFVQNASRARWDKLLAADAEIPLRRRFRPPASRRVQCRSVALAPDQLQRVAAAAAFEEVSGTCRVAHRFTVVSVPADGVSLTRSRRRWVDSHPTHCAYPFRQ